MICAHQAILFPWTLLGESQMQLTVHSGPMSRIQCQTSAADYLIGGNCNHGYIYKVKKYPLLLNLYC